MLIPFTKYHGTGNDFILIDGIRNPAIKDALTQEVVAKMCHRRYGIAADGLIILDQSADSDFYMTYYNSDGRLSSMCGNGSRCIVHFTHSLSYIQDNCTFYAVDGIHHAKVQGDTISVQLSDVNKVKQELSDYILDTGSPHYVRFVDKVSELDVVEEAHKIRYSDTYKSEGINVNFVEVADEGIIVRTYERGVEAETYSCGTGVVASSIAYATLIQSYDKPIDISTLGGELSVRFTHEDGQYSQVWLTGPAVRVFEGVYTLLPDVHMG